MTTTPHHEHYEVVRLDDLTIDRRVQRKEGTNEKRVHAIASKYNSGSVGTITVSRRKDGTTVILDGAHRCAASLQVGRKTIGAMVHEGLTLAQEAELFDQLNDFKAPSYISRTLASMVAGDPDANAIISTIRKHGWHISANGYPGSFCAIQAAERVYRTGVGALPAGEHQGLLDDTLTVITDAWHHDRDSVNQLMVQAVGQVLARFGDAVDRNRLTTVLSREMPTSLIARARTLQKSQGGTTVAALSKIIVTTYNNRLRSNLLPEWVWTR